MTDYLTAADAAKVLRCTPYTVATMCRAGTIAASKPSKAWLIKPADLDAYITAHRNVA